jgi:hypothetical protein
MHHFSPTYLQFAKAIKVSFDVATCRASGVEITTWAPQTTDILVWKTKFDVVDVLLPTLHQLKLEQEEILADPDIDEDDRKVANSRVLKLQDGITGWESTLAKNQVLDYSRIKINISSLSCVNHEPRLISHSRSLKSIHRSTLFMYRECLMQPRTRT